MEEKDMKTGKDTIVYHPELSNIQDCVIGNNCTIHSHIWIGNDVKIGNNVKIQAFTFIPTGVTIEDNCFIGPRVTFTNDKNLEVKGKSCWRETIVKEGAKIGACVTIVAGVTIGKGSLIGAGSVVVRDVPPYEKVYGVPAKRHGKTKPKREA